MEKAALSTRKRFSWVVRSLKERGVSAAIVRVDDAALGGWSVRFPAGICRLWVLQGRKDSAVG